MSSGLNNYFNREMNYDEQTSEDDDDYPDQEEAHQNVRGTFYFQ